MANMTSQTDEPERSTPQGEESPSVVTRAAAGAATLTNQQLRKARERVDEEISSQRERVSGRVRTLGRALKGATQTLDEDDVVAQCLHFASDKIDDVAGYVSEINPTRVADDLRNIARERPAWFFGGAFLLGLALGRFARASAEELALTDNSEREPRLARATAGSNARARTGSVATRVPAPRQPRPGAPRS
jgi:hypothetical protein